MAWRTDEFVAFDLETSGKYPLDAEICELGAVKWRDGKVVDTFQTLIKPSRPMGEEVIKIHNITNEMVTDAPTIAEKIGEFHAFLGEAYGIAHHAPFDMGFLMVEFERAGLAAPEKTCFCTSLLARKMIPESHNHRLKTLVDYLKIPLVQAHRALDDAEACLGVALRCFERAGDVGVEELLAKQGGGLPWDHYSIRALEQNAHQRFLIQSLREGGSVVKLTYDGGSRPGQPREVRPVGLVRNPDGDFLVAIEVGDTKPKRYLLDKITGAQ